MSDEDESETLMQISQLMDLSKPFGGIVYCAQLVDVLCANNQTLSAQVWDPSARQMKDTPRREAGGREPIDWVARTRKFAEQNGANPSSIDDSVLADPPRSSNETGQKLSTQSILRLLLQHGHRAVIVLLVDARFLPYASREKKQSKDYSGHFITIFAYNPFDGLVEVFDSFMMKANPVQKMTVQQLNRCRRLSSMACQAKNPTIVFQRNAAKRKRKRQHDPIKAVDLEAKLIGLPPTTDRKRAKVT